MEQFLMDRKNYKDKVLKDPKVSDDG